jgi:hypothetical protein
MDVFWLDAAIADIEESVAYIEANDPGARDRLLQPCTRRPLGSARTRESDVAAGLEVLVSSSFPLFPLSSLTGSALIASR